MATATTETAAPMGETAGKTDKTAEPAGMAVERTNVTDDPVSGADEPVGGTLQIKRAYEVASAQDGVRVLVDRLWPRGVSKERAALDEWAKDSAPSPALRTWFAHDPARFATFSVRYEEELDDSAPARELARRCAVWLRESNVTLVYAARDPACNHAIVLRDWLARHIKPEASTAAMTGETGVALRGQARASKA